MVSSLLSVSQDTRAGNDSNWPDDLQWKGYLAQTVVLQNSTNKMVGSAFSHIEAGVQASYEIHNNVDFRGMLSILGDKDDQVRANYMMLVLHTDDDDFGVRIGRINHVLGFYNEPRNHPSARQWEFPPQGIYRDGFEYLARSGDGVQGYYNLQGRTYNLSVELNYSKPILYPMSAITEGHFLVPLGKFSDDSRISGLNVGFFLEETGTSFRYDPHVFDFKHNLLGNMKTYIHYFGVKQYLSERDEFTAEYIYVDKYGPGWTNATGMLKAPASDGFALTYGHAFNDEWCFHVGVDGFWINTDDRNGESLSAVGIPAARGYHESLNFTVGYRNNPWSVKWESHFVQGTNVLPSAYNDIGGMKEKWNYHALTVAYEF